MRQSPEAWAQQLDFASMESRHGLPAGILTNLVRQESAGDSEALGPETRYGRARGLCQFIDSTADSMGVNSRDPRSSAEGAARYLEDLMDQFGGDPVKAAAAYNWGPGNMRACIRRYGENWREHLPAETANYINQVCQGIGDSYVARHDRGETTPPEDTAEAARRRQSLIDAGMPEPMADALANMQGADGILGQMFFALISTLFERVMQQNGVDPSVTDPSLTTPEPATQVADGTTVTPPTVPATAAATTPAPATQART